MGLESGGVSALYAAETTVAAAGSLSATKLLLIRSGAGAALR